jgi:simple sugar transport system substrate-binding protein
MTNNLRRNILLVPLLMLGHRLSSAQMSGGLPPLKQNESNAKSISTPNIKNVEPIKIAFVFVGPIGDGGWTYAHDVARRIVEQQFRSKIVVTYVEKVPESAEAEKVFRDLALQGNKLIFGTTFGYMEVMLKVARQFKEVRFEHATGYKTAHNLRTYDSRMYEGVYLAGVIAGSMTKSNTLGFVASIPIPEVIRNINTFTLGAQSVNPNVKTKVVWVNEWFNPQKEAEAATALINADADILMQNTDSPAVIQTAQKMGKRAFGWDSDMTLYGSGAHLASVFNNWAPYYLSAVKDLIDGKWSTGQSWWGIKQGSVELVSIARDVPYNVRNKLELIKDGIQKNNLNIWQGPIAGQDGQLVLQSGVVADDKFLGGMKFYVKGVVGKVPT